MTGRVAVVDPVPLYRAGLLTTLNDSGFDPAAPDDVITWAATEPEAAVIVTDRLGDHLRLLTRLRRVSAALVVLCLLTVPNPVAYRRAHHAGADITAPWDVATDTIPPLIRAAAGGHRVLVLPAALSVALPGPYDGPAVDISVEQQGWLGALACGDTVDSIAQATNMSPRTLQRQLRLLYSTLGATNRTHAVTIALTTGLITAPATAPRTT